MNDPWKPQSVILATDLTATSAMAADTAIEIARRYGTQVTLLHVFRYLAHHRYLLPVTWMLDEMRHDAHSRLLQLKKRVTDAQCLAYSKVVEDEDPTTAILTEVERVDKTIVVLGTHARDPIERFFLGSTAETVLRKTRIPVVTVGPHVTRPFGSGTGSILFATDLTERSFEPLALLPGLMNLATQLTVVHVTNSVLDTDAEASMHLLKLRMSMYLAEDVIKDQVHWKVVHGTDVARVLAQEAAKENAELLIIGIHRSGDFHSHLPLKTGFQIIVSAPCAVLSVCS